MKNIFRIFLLSFLTVSLVGCSDFLNERNTTTYDGAAMTSSKGALESAVLGVHRQLANSGFKSGAFCEWLAPASGVAHWGHTSNALTNPLERWSSQLKFTRFSKHTESYDTFKSLYRTVYLANHLLDVMGDSPVDEEYKSQIAGEVYFLRAMTYFYLVRLYGDVTLHTKAPLTHDEVYGVRTNFWEVYCQIIDDLNKAEKQMRSFNQMVAIAGGNSSGRVCDYAAVACRSLVYLTIGTLLDNSEDNFWVNRTPDFSKINITTAEDAYKLALADAVDVLENGPFELCPDYRQLFRWTEPEDWQLKERIWVMPRSPESGDAGSGLTMWALPCYYMGTAKVENFGRCRPDRWFFQKWCETYRGLKGGDINNAQLYGADNKNIYVSCEDPRLNVNIAHTTFTGQNKTIYNCYPANNRIHITSTDLMKYYGLPFYKKYYDPTFNNCVGIADLYVMRLAEVYLIAAEATAHLHGTTANQYGKSAIDYVNVLLDRARNSTNGSPTAEPADWQASDFANKEELLTAIFWERCFEMPFEHHEYFDTHRMGAKWIVENIAKPKNIFLYEEAQNDFVSGSSTYSGYRTIYYGADFKYDEDWTQVRKGLINAYPYEELVYNPLLDETLHDPNLGQNPVEVYWR